MTTTASEQTPVAVQVAVVRGCTGEIELPGEARLVVEWRCQAEGRAATGRVLLRGRAEQRTFELDARTPSFDFNLGVDRVSGVLWLSVGMEAAHLCGDVQTGPSTVFEGPIAEWSLRPSPPVPDPPRRENDGVVVSPPARELVTFLATVDGAPLTDAAPPALLVCPDAAALPLVVQLAALRAEKDAATLMAAAARTFEAGADFVRSLVALGTPPARFPLLLARFRERRGFRPLTELTTLADEILALSEPLPDYLASAAAQEAQSRLWQSLFAWAWSVPPPPMADAQAPTTGLRAFGLLARLAAGDERLVEEGYRGLVLHATPVLPTAITPVAAAPAPLGSTRVLGAGLLQTLRERLRGYETGEIAFTVNVLGHERQWLAERHLSRRTESETSTERDRATRASDERRQSRSDARDGLEDVVASEGRCRDWNVSIDYKSDGLSRTNTGSSQTKTCPRRRVAREAVTLAQSVVASARERLGRSVDRQRARLLVEERERVSRVDRDNRAADTRQVGIYRFLRKRLLLSLHDRGARLVCEFLVARPAAPYLQSIESSAAPPLVAPTPLADLAPTFASIDATNYRALAARYGWADPPAPPEAQRVARALLESVPPRVEGAVFVPDGFAIDQGELVWTASDATLPVWGSIGDHLFGASAVLPASRARAPLPLARPAEGNPCPCDTPPPPVVVPTPGQGTVTFKGADVGAVEARVPVSVFSAAPTYSASVRLSLIRDPKEFADAFAAWQLATYAALDEAYGRQLAAYRRARARRIRRSSRHRRRAIETGTLRSAALQELWALHTRPDDDEPSTLRALERALDWSSMPYRFYPWGPGTPPSARGWNGEALLDPKSDRLFETFLHAGSARVLTPVTPGHEIEILFYYAFGFLPPGAAAPGVPEALASALLGFLEMRDAEPLPDPIERWTEEVPTSLLYLEEGSALPVVLPEGAP